MTDELLEEQIRYYRERAPEYDATSRPDGDPFDKITREAIAALRTMGSVERAIELGAGTGQFTGLVASVARQVTAVDSSPQALALNVAKVTAPNVERVAADLFAWQPPEPAELVVFTFVLSHIPRDRFAAFWDRVRGMLAPDGRVFLLDEAPHGVWQEERTDEPGGEVVHRTLLDGRRFRVVKVLWDPPALTEALAGLGWDARLVRRDPFYWGTASR